MAGKVRFSTAAPSWRRVAGEPCLLLPLISLVMVLAAMLLFSAAPRGESPLATVTLVEGDGAQARARANADWRKPAEDMPVFSGAVLRTDSNSKVELQFADNSILRIHTLSTVELNEPKPGSKDVLTSSGKTWFHLKKQPQQTTFQVRTPTAVAAVRGTTFRIEVDPRQGDLLAVEDGALEVEQGPGKGMLTARRMARLRRGARFTPQSFDPDKTQRWERWTNRHETDRMKKLGGHVRQFRERAKDIVKSSRDVIGDVRALRDAQKEITRQTHEIRGHTQKILALKNRIMGAGGRGGNRRGRRPKMQDKIEESVRELLARIDDTLQQINAVRPLLDTQAKRAGSLIAKISDMQKDLDTLQQKTGEFADRLRQFQQRREFDPQWAELKPGFNQAQQDRAEITRHAASVGEAMSGRMEQLNEKEEKLLAAVSRLLNEFLPQFRDTLNQAKTDLEAARSELQAL